MLSVYSDTDIVLYDIKVCTTKFSIDYILSTTKPTCNQSQKRDRHSLRMFWRGRGGDPGFWKVGLPLSNYWVHS